MSKRLAAIHNHTDNNWSLGCQASGKQVIQLGSTPDGKPLVRGNYPIGLDIPDNSSSKDYFATNHMHLALSDPRTGAQRAFSFWNDDWKNYNISFCKVDDWLSAHSMRGGNEGGDGDDVVLKISESPTQPGEIELTAVTLTGIEEKKAIGTAFLKFARSQGIRPSDKKNPQKVLAYMRHPDFQAIREHGAEAGYKTAGIVFGQGGSIVIGGEVQVGYLHGTAGGDWYDFSSEAVSVGAQEGITDSIGFYMSKEPVADINGHAFFADLSLEFGAGVGGRVFVTFTGYFGFQVLYLIGGEEIEVSVGIESSQVAKLQT